MKVNTIILLIILMGVLACKKANNELPKVKFDFEKMSKNKHFSQYKQVLDLEKLFSKEQNNELELYLLDLKKEKFINIMVLTSPFKENLEKEWEVTSSLNPKGMIITFSKSMKTINVAFEKSINKNLAGKIRDTIIKQTILPNFIEENYYVGIKKGLIEIINNLEKSQ
jgi:uncharacterized protein